MMQQFDLLPEGFDILDRETQREFASIDKGISDAVMGVEEYLQRVVRSCDPEQRSGNEAAKNRQANRNWTENELR